MSDCAKPLYCDLLAELLFKIWKIFIVIKIELQPVNHFLVNTYGQESDFGHCLPYFSRSGGHIFWMDGVNKANSLDHLGILDGKGGSDACAKRETDKI